MRLGGLPPRWPPLLATRGPGATSARHAHHALHVLLCRDGTLTVNGHRAPGVVTAPDAPHAISTSGDTLLVFVDPESEAGAAIAATLPAPLRLLTERERDALWVDPLEVMLEGGGAWVEKAVAVLGGPALPRRRVHPKVRKLLRLLHEGEEARSLNALAAKVGLSPGRLMHAFTESIGIPLRPYLAWRRVQLAAAGIVGGMKLGDAAHAAGFSDAAHMTRTFKAMFGVTPSQLVQGSERARP